ncbi:MAG: alpha-L-fucosidase [Verrucomicrobia bacterium]|nr:alpha-L-fucosidase [Verrucomicrobiota bacterium]MBU1735486.1 alpha-L-fucosidase [Verrucomicrobiota bacterium]MBU1856881.1 alpha-L-fucosidase [Verrucomicrobiota bacterium]
MTRPAFPRRAIHLDCHTMPRIYDAGCEFDAEEFAATLHKAGVQYITVFARCNLGFAYYPTRIGTVYPGLKVDMLGGMVKACHKRKIAVAAYFNAGLDHEHAVLHRDWVKVNQVGQVYEFKMKVNKTGPDYAFEKDAPPHGSFFRRMCLNTGYGRHLLDMTAEVLDRYPVDGLFFDCFALDACYGEECLQGMQKENLDFQDEAQAREYCWRITQRFMRDVKAMLRKRRRDLYLCFNGLPYAVQPAHSELEILPTGGWGYDIMPAYARYVRTLPNPWFMMTGRFQKSWGDLGGLRPEASLMFDCYNAIANGGGCSVGDHFHPRGRLDKHVYDRIGNVYAKTRALDPWTDGAKARTEVAVLFPETRFLPCASLGSAGDKIQSLFGAARLLVELKQQFDVCTGDGDIAKYRVLVLPDNVTLDTRLAESVRRHLKRGGGVISSAFSGLNPEKTAFALKEYRLTYEGPESWAPSFFKAEGALAREVSDRITTIYRPGIAMHALKDARVMARLYKPYFNHGIWDGRHEYLYTPPDKDTGRSALVRCGNLFHFSFPVFAGYFNDVVVEFKYMVRHCLDQILPQPMVKVPNLPSFGQVTITAQTRRRMVHLLTYLPEKRGPVTQIIEEPIVVRDVELALRRDVLPRVKRVCLAPSQKELAVREEGDYICVTVPEVAGYQMVVFEE